MKNLMQYKGYYGSVDYDPDEPIFYGKLDFIKALVSYESQSAEGIKLAFHDAVDDYLAMCDQQAIKPEQPFKGSFNIRTGHELHRKVALAAKKENLSINRFICHVLGQACNESYSRRAE